MSILSRISTATDERSARLAGIALMLAGVGMFSFGDALGKALVARYPVNELLLLRAAAPLAILLALVWRQGRRLPRLVGGAGPLPIRLAPVGRQRASLPRLERPWLQLLRVALSTAEVAAFFVAVVYLPLADVITYYLACPIFVTALSAIVLREHVGWRRWSAVGIGFCGVLIAMQPSAQTVSWPALIALAGSFSFALLMIVTRSLRATPDIVLAATQFSGTFCVGLVLAPFAWKTPTFPALAPFAPAR